MDVPRRIGGPSGGGRSIRPNRAVRNKRIIRQSTTGVPDSFPFVTPPDYVETKTFPIQDGNFFFFQGCNSTFTLQYLTDIVIDGKVYKSVDHYYQNMKVYDITGRHYHLFDDPFCKNFSAVAKNVLRELRVSRNVIDKWRMTCGLQVIQKALLQRIVQCKAFRDELLETGQKIIAHSFTGDNFFGTGCSDEGIKRWCKSDGMVLKYPMAFPLTSETAQYVPTLGNGRNILGAIYMALRELARNRDIMLVPIELTAMHEFQKFLDSKPLLGLNQYPDNVVTRQALYDNPTPIPPSMSVLAAFANNYAVHGSDSSSLRLPKTRALIHAPKHYRQFTYNKPSISSPNTGVPATNERFFYQTPSAATNQSKRQSNDGVSFLSEYPQIDESEPPLIDLDKPFVQRASRLPDFSLDIGTFPTPLSNGDIVFSGYRATQERSSPTIRVLPQNVYDWTW